MKKIELTRGKETLVSDEDYEELKQHNWCVTPQDGGKWRAVRRDPSSSVGSLIYMHRQILDPPDDMQVDHINGDPLDNRRENLRLATQSQNLANCGKQRNNTTGYKGVTQNSGHPNSYTARTKKNSKNIYLGSFSSKEMAALVYDLWALDIHGEFARTNFEVVSHG